MLLQLWGWAVQALLARCVSVALATGTGAAVVDAVTLPQALVGKAIADWCGLQSLC